MRTRKLKNKENMEIEGVGGIREMKNIKDFLLLFERMRE